MDPANFSWIIIAIISIIGLWIIFYFIPIGLWFQALVSGVRISLLQLVFMRWRKVPPGVIVRTMIEAHKAGLKMVKRDELEAHFLAGGHVENVVHALVSAEKANIDLSFKMATAIDLAGRDVLEAVRMSVNPKVINTPPVSAVAKDGIQLICKARVTVRANIKQLVGGAGEETILARVGEGIVSSIGSSHSHKTVLENPDNISKVVLDKGLDAGTAFEILSIDIADIDIGKNIGAYLQMDQAEADKNIAQAKAEERRAMAVALEQEFKAKAQDARAKVIEAEVQIPLAMAEAFRNGNMGIMDYMRFRNIDADTNMRDSISTNGLEFLSSHVGTTLPAEGKWEESMKWWDTAIAAHKAAGVSYIVIPSLGKTGYESLAELKKYCDYYNVIGEKCNKAGIRFGYHNHSKEFAVLEGEVMYDYMLKNTDPAKVMFQLDLYWIAESGNDPLDYFARYPGRFELWHVKDKTEIGCPDCKMDFARIFEKAKQSGMKHYIVEVERYNYTPMESVKRSIDYLLTQKYIK
jgi:uncharacterized protein YqfA (UPF0365 family)